MNRFDSQADLQLVTFFLENEEYGVDVMQVREIISITEITTTANAPYYVEGIINLRGSVIPVVSLRKRLGLAELDDQSLSFIAVMDFKGKLTGFIIDEISDVVRIRCSDLIPSVETIEQKYIDGIYHNGEKIVVLMNLQSLIEG